eukprot:225954_1
MTPCIVSLMHGQLSQFANLVIAQSQTSIQSNYLMTYITSLFVIAICIAISHFLSGDGTHSIHFDAFSLLRHMSYHSVSSSIASIVCVVATDCNHSKSTFYALCLFLTLSSAQMTEWFNISDPILPRTVSWSASGYSSTNKVIWMLDRQYKVSYSIETNTITDYGAVLPSADSAAGRGQYFSQIGSILYLIEPKSGADVNPSVMNTFNVDTGVHTRSFASIDPPVADNGCLASIEDGTDDYLAVIYSGSVKILRLTDTQWLTGLSNTLYGGIEHGCLTVNQKLFKFGGWCCPMAKVEYLDVSDMTNLTGKSWNPSADLIEAQFYTSGMAWNHEIIVHGGSATGIVSIIDTRSLTTRQGPSLAVPTHKSVFLQVDGVAYIFGAGAFLGYQYSVLGYGWIKNSDPIFPQMEGGATGYNSKNKTVWMLNQQDLVSYSFESNTVVDYGAVLPNVESATGRCQYFSQIGSILYIIEVKSGADPNPSVINTFNVDTAVYTRSFASIDPPVADNGCLASIEDGINDYLAVIHSSSVKIVRLSDMQWLSGLSNTLTGGVEHGCLTVNQRLFKFGGWCCPMAKVEYLDVSDMGNIAEPQSWTPSEDLLEPQYYTRGVQWDDEIVVTGHTNVVSIIHTLSLTTRYGGEVPSPYPGSSTHHIRFENTLYLFGGHQFFGYRYTRLDPVASSLVPTGSPTPAPTLSTSHPTTDPTTDPTVDPTTDPTIDPTIDPTVDPTVDPTTEPTTEPTQEPTADPTTEPTVEPTHDPTADPTTDPSSDPTIDPTIDPTTEPTTDPTSDPTKDPTHVPTRDPTVDPTMDPTIDPTSDPTTDPTMDPTDDPTVDPTNDPTQDPTKDPTKDPTSDPTKDPTTYPTVDPTIDPTVNPTSNPSTAPTGAPSASPTIAPHSLEEAYANSLDEKDSATMNEAYIYCILFGVPALIIFFVFLMKSTVLKDKLLSIDRVYYVSVALYFLQVFDLYSDAMFTLQLYAYYNWAKHTEYEITESEINQFEFLFLCSLIFTILPYCANFVSSGRIVAMIASDPIISTYSKEWFKYNSGNYSMGVLLSGGSYFTLKVINSNFLGLPQLSAGLSAKQIERFSAHKVLYNTLMENLPQM